MCKLAVLFFCLFWLTSLLITNIKGKVAGIGNHDYLMDWWTKGTGLVDHFLASCEKMVH